MNRQEKLSLTEHIKTRLQSSEGIFLVGVQGLTVEQSEKLRRGVRAQGGSVKIVKNTLLKRAVADIQDMSQFADKFRNQIAVITAEKNATAVAKTVQDLAKEFETMHVVAGMFERSIIDSNKFSFIASLPSHEVLIARIAGALKAPLSRIAFVLATHASQAENQNS
ncbi:MAG: 50S ribosomal protein L10 [candidate division TM6 bacterium GW2011_GWE2_41_16]|nr:MAG: 50S ribosomal protein L10 [candidate division TM6 bacterium GW2011_GWE2_41_16]